MKKCVLPLLLVGLLTGCATSPTGKSQLLMYDRGTVDKMGIESFETLKQNEKISTDRAVNQYAQCVSEAIVAAVPTDYGYSVDEWEVVVFDSEAVNAFALPGAKIGIYTGLIDVADNADQLAAVVGHEVGHVLANHSNARLSSQQLTTLGLTLAGVALAETDNQKLWMTGLGVGAQVLLLLPYSRSHETEADEIGQALMAKAGFNPTEAAKLWVNMGKHAQKAPLELLSTHPSHATRIADLQSGEVGLRQVYLEARKQGKRPSCRKP